MVRVNTCRALRGLVFDLVFNHDFRDDFSHGENVSDQQQLVADFPLLLERERERERERDEQRYICITRVYTKKISFHKHNPTTKFCRVKAVHISQ
jgi:hypothetical protein